MRKLLLIFAACLATAALGLTKASAQEKEKVVTGTVSMLTPTSVQILDEYISNQLYTGSGAFTGWNIKFGAIYKQHESLSWNLYFNSFNRLKWLEERGIGSLNYLTNPAETQTLKYTMYNVGYGTYYHWNFGKKLMVKAGGMFDVYGAMKNSSPDGVNNNMNFDAQLMFKGHAAIKYGWDFKKWALDLHGSVTLPLFGLITADHPSEPAASILGTSDHSVMNSAFSHIFFGSYHNYMSLDYEMGLDFVFKSWTLTLGFGSTRKWWNVYDIQNIRTINYTTLGFAFDIVSRNKFKSSNKNF